jgi:micrococcal nuclease
MARWPYRLWPVLIVVALAAASAAEIQAKVVGIADGDTITVLHEGKQIRVRLHGIDAPESGQAFGARAKQFTSSLAFGQTVTLRDRGHDRYGRLLAEVVLPDGRSLNREIVRAGFAWWFRKYAPSDQELAKLEAEARAERRGLWADPDPVPPWNYRRKSP